MNSYAFCYVVLNAGDYLHYSLASIIELMNMNSDSCIVIVEAADQFSHQLEKTKDGLSIDGTAEIIRHWQEKYPKKIIYKQLGHINDKRESRNKCLEIVRDKFNPTHIFNVDGDEGIKQEDFIAIDACISEHSDKLVFWLQQYLFWGKFATRYTDHFGGHKEIIFANRHNLKYNWWHTRVSITSTKSLDKDYIKKLPFPYYHYGHVQSKYRLFMKRLYSCGQLSWFHDNIEPTILWISNQDYWKERCFKGRPWEEKHWADTIKVKLNQHPPAFQEHPWSKLTEEAIWNKLEPYPTLMP